MKYTVTLAGLILALSANPAEAQQATPEQAPVQDRMEEVVDRSGIEAALESIAAEAGPGLREALAGLAMEMEEVATRIATDPQLRLAALRTAEGVVEVAQVMVEEHADDLQEALRRMADRLADLAPPEIATPELR